LVYRDRAMRGPVPTMATAAVAAMPSTPSAIHVGVKAIAEAIMRYAPMAMMVAATPFVARQLIPSAMRSTSSAVAAVMRASVS
jgi:hypothetical protein